MATARSKGRVNVRVLNEIGQFHEDSPAKRSTVCTLLEAAHAAAEALEGGLETLRTTLEPVAGQVLLAKTADLGDEKEQKEPLAIHRLKALIERIESVEYAVRKLAESVRV